MILSFTVRERHCRESNLEPTAWNSTVRPTESYFEDVIRPATLWSWRQPILNIVGIVLVRFWICCEYVFHLPVSDELKKINKYTNCFSTTVSSTHWKESLLSFLDQRPPTRRGLVGASLKHEAAPGVIHPGGPPLRRIWRPCCLRQRGHGAPLVVSRTAAAATVVRRQPERGWRSRTVAVPHTAHPLSLIRSWKRVMLFCEITCIL